MPAFNVKDPHPSTQMRKSLFRVVYSKICTDMYHWDIPKLRGLALIRVRESLHGKFLMECTGKIAPKAPQKILASPLTPGKNSGPLFEIVKKSPP